MRIFLSYRFTGENPDELQEIIQNICLSLKEAGHTYFCSFWKEDFFNQHKFTHRQILEHALKELDNSDCILAFVKSKEKSEGMLIEIGYALAKRKKIILAIKKDIRTTFIREMADQIIEFERLDELYDKLNKLK